MHLGIVLHDIFVVVLQKLTALCEEHIRTIIKESAADYLQDAALAHACANEVSGETVLLNC